MKVYLPGKNELETVILHTHLDHISTSCLKSTNTTAINHSVNVDIHFLREK